MMNEVTKPNDMLLAVLNKPNASTADLLKNDINLTNTQLLSREDYKKTPLVKKAFTQDGVFNEEAFNKVYDVAKYQYEQMDNSELMSNLMETLEYSPTSFFRPLNSKTYDTVYEAGVNKNNPLGQATGIEGVNYKSEPTRSAKEAAQSGGIWDPINKKWLGETAESRSLLDKIFGESLIYAKYTKDGWQANPITGEEGFHQTGEFITDANGKYFTQLAGSADLTKGTEIVKLSDILTKEGSALNHIDFFDSDGLDKSVMGLAMKTLVGTGIYLVPYLGPVYTGAKVLIGFGESMPQLYKSVAGLFGDNTTQVSPTANKLINWFSKFDKSMSDYGSTHFWSLESMGNQLADVVGQLYQQRMMASLSMFLKPAQIKKTDSLQDLVALRKEAEERAKFARALSTGYMALTQANQTYNDALEGGYDQKTAGIATLLTTGALFGIMGFNESAKGLGTWFLDKTVGYDKELLRAPVDKAGKNYLFKVADEIEKAALGDKDRALKLQGWLLKWANKADNMFRLGGEGMWKGFMNEAVEEVSEEVVQDGIKGLIDGLTWLGYKQGWYDNEEASFGGWSNVFSKEGLERYLQTFVAGGLGGAVFDFHQNKVEKAIRRWRGQEPAAIKQADLDMIDISLQGRTDEFIKSVKYAGRFISNRKTTVKDTDGKYTIAGNGDQTLRDIAVQETVNRMKTIDALVKQVTQGGGFEKLPSELQTVDFREQIAKHYKPFIADKKIVDYIDKRFQKSVEDAVLSIKDAAKIQQDLDAEETTAEQKALLKKQLEAANQKVNEKLKYTRSFFSGQAHIDNFAQSQFLLSPEMRSCLNMGMNEEEFYENVLRGDSKLSYNELQQSGPEGKMTKDYVSDRYKEFMYNENNLDSLCDTLPLLQKAFDNLSERIGPSLTSWLTNVQHQAVIRKAINKMKQEYEARKQEIDNTNYEMLLREEMGDETWNSLDPVKQAQAIQEAYIEASANLVKEYQIDKLIQIIQNDPKAFSNTERYNIDFATELMNLGLISIDESTYDENEIKLLKQLINTEFVNAPLLKFTEGTVRQLISNVNKKLADDTNSFRKAIFNHMDERLNGGKKEGEALINVNLAEVVFSGTGDAWNSDFEFFKIKSLEDYIGQPDKTGKVPGILADTYDFILEGKRVQDQTNRERYFKQLKDFLDNQKPLGKKEDPGNVLKQLIDTIKESYFSKPDIILTNTISGIRAEIFDRLNNLTAFGIVKGSKLEQQLQSILVNLEAITGKWNKDAEEFSIMSDSKTNAAETFEKAYKDKRVSNPFKEAISQVYFALGGKNHSIVDYLADKANAIVNGDADASQVEIPANIVEELNHVAATLQTLQQVAKWMAPTLDFDGVTEYDGVNKLRKDFADSMGVDSSKILTIDSGTYELFATVLQELNRQASNLEIVFAGMNENQLKEFEDLREDMIKNSYNLHYYHCEPPADDGDDEDLKKLFHIDGIFEEEAPISLEEKQQKVLEYRQALHKKLRGLINDTEALAELTGYDEDRDGADTEAFLIKWIVNKQQKDDSLFYYGDADDVANDMKDGMHNTQQQYWLNEVMMLVGAKADPKKINQAIFDVLKANSQFYPRQDQIKAVEQAVIGVLNPKVYMTYGKILEEKYNDPSTNGAVKQYVNGLIRIPGPAGSGKTTLYNIIVSTLKALGEDITHLQVTAKSQRKVDDLTVDLSGLADAPKPLTLNAAISGLAEISANYEEFQTALFSEIAKHKPTYDKDAGWSVTNKITAKHNRVDYEIQLVLDNTTNPSKLIATFEIKDDKGKTKYTFTTNVNLSVKNTEEDTYTAELELQDYTAHVSINDFKKGDYIGDTSTIIIDECTNLNPIEWDVLSQLQIPIIATGDNMQRGYTINYANEEGKPNTTAVGDENILGFNVPALKSVYRGHNNAVRHNELAMRLAFKEALKANGESHLGLKGYMFVTTSVNKLKELRPILEFQYHLSEQGFFGARFIKTQPGIASPYYDQSLQGIPKDASILLIVKNNAEIDKAQKDLETKGFKNVSAVLQKDIQGAEADYAIAYNLDNVTDDVYRFTELYTLVTRGRKGFISYNETEGATLFSDLKNEVVNQVHTLNRSRVDDDKGNQWLEAYGRNINSLKGEEPSPKEPPTKTLKDGEEDEGDSISDDDSNDASAEKASDEDESEKPNSEALKKTQETNTTIREILTDGDQTSPFAMMHQLGYVPEVSDFDAEIEQGDWQIDAAKAKESSFYAVLYWLNNDFNASGFGSLDSTEKSVLEQIHNEFGKDKLGKYKYSKKQAYLGVVNALTQAVVKGQLNTLYFKASDGKTQLKYYLKPNNDEGKTPNRYISVRIPLLFDGTGNVSTSVVIGILGRSTSIDADGKVTDSKQGSIIHNLSDNEAKLVRLKKDDISGYLSKRNDRINDTRKTTRATNTKIMFPYTGNRPFVIDTELNKNKEKGEQFNQLLALGRWQLEDWLKMGWEYAEINKSSGEPTQHRIQQMKQNDELEGFINSYRYSPISPDGYNALKSLGNTNAYYVLLKPVGVDDQSQWQPVIIKTATNWQSWGSRTDSKRFPRTTSSHNMHMSTYTAKMLVVGLAKIYGVDLHMGHFRQSHILDRSKLPGVTTFNIGHVANGNGKEVADGEYGFTDDTQQLLVQLWEKVHKDVKHYSSVKIALNAALAQILRSASNVKTMPATNAQNAVEEELNKLRYLQLGTNGDSSKLDTLQNVLKFMDEKIPFYAYTFDNANNSAKFIERVYERPNFVIDLSTVEDFNPTNEPDSSGGGKHNPVTTIEETTELDGLIQNFKDAVKEWTDAGVTIPDIEKMEDKPETIVTAANAIISKIQEMIPNISVYKKSKITTEFFKDYDTAAENNPLLSVLIATQTEVMEGQLKNLLVDQFGC